MEFKIAGSVDPLLTVTLGPGEAVAAERNAMVAMDASLSLTGSSRGGVLKALSRKLLNGETFFQELIRAQDRPGSVMLAPTVPGEIRLLETGETQYLLADGAFLAASEGVTLTTRTQKLGRALLGNSGGFFVIGTEGTGTVAVSGFGSMTELTVTPDRPVIVDNGHLVAWDTGLNYELVMDTGHKGFFGSLLHSQTTGEGIVLRFTGSGRILVCSRNRQGFVDWLFGQRPETDKLPQNKAA